MGPGDILREKYQLVESIGKGGMGEVFRAIHLESGSDVAIKVVSRVLLDDVLIARLEREALAAGRISSDYVPHVLEIDRTDDGELFLVMQLLFGESLSQRLRGGEPTSWEDAQLVGDNVLRGLIDAHAAGVVHRDLKPGNIFLELLEDGSTRAKILDFGVCKLDIADTEKLTMTGESVGTIAYMAPEQIRGASKVNERADLYSFAMVIYEMLSGRLAYNAQGQIALLASKLEKSANPLRHAARVPIPAGLDVIIDTCLSRDPADRYSSALEVLSQWRSLGAPTLGPDPIEPPPSSNAVPSPPTDTGMSAPTILTTSTPSASRASLALAVGAVIASSIIVAAAVHRRTAAAAAPVVDPSAMLAPTVAPLPSTSGQPQQQANPTGMEDLDSVTTADPKPTPAPHHGHHAKHPTGPTIIDKPRF